MQKNKSAEGWYQTKGWKLINDKLVEVAARGYGLMYIENFDVIPPNIDKASLAAAFNEDSNSWVMEVEEDDDEQTLVIKKKGHSHYEG